MNNRKSIGREIRASVETLIFDHDLYFEALEQVRRSIDDTLDGFTPCLAILVGPSRCGKSEILKAIAQEFPETVADGMRQIPVLLVKVPSGGGVRALEEAVYRALGTPPPKRDVKETMILQLKRSGVRIILFDEANHLVEHGMNITKEKVADWFKTLYDDAKNIGLVIAGIPRLELLVKDNNQLRNRADRAVVLMPYRYDDPVQVQTFASCVGTFMREFTERGCHFTVEINPLVRHCYAASAGIIGLLARFFSKLAEPINDPCEITWEMCHQATLSLNLPGNGLCRPFESERIEDAELMGVITSHLDRDYIKLPVREGRR